MEKLDYYVEILKAVCGKKTFLEQICAIYVVRESIDSIPKESLSNEELDIIREIHEIVRCIESPKNDVNIDKYLIEALVTRAKHFLS